jgi:hypothetical protein
MPDVEKSDHLAAAQIAAPAAGAEKTNDWPGSCVREARRANPVVTDATSGILTELLQGLLSERALTSGELTVLANRLMDDMISSTPQKSTSTEPLE